MSTIWLEFHVRMHFSMRNSLRWDLWKKKKKKKEDMLSFALTPQAVEICNISRKLCISCAIRVYNVFHPPIRSRPPFLNTPFSFYYPSLSNVHLPPPPREWNPPPLQNPYPESTRQKCDKRCNCSAEWPRAHGYRGGKTETRWRYVQIFIPFSPLPHLSSPNFCTYMKY